MVPKHGAVWIKWDPEAVIKFAEYASERKMREVCKFVESEMKAGAPVDTGKLKSAIGHQVTKGNFQVEGLVGVRHGFKRTHVARFLEFGTSKMQARPFMRRAVFENKERIMAIFGKKDVRLR